MIRFPFRLFIIVSCVFVALLLLHTPFLRLPYYWDEAGYYIPAALDFYRQGLLIPTSTPPEGHTPLVMIYLGLAWRVFGFSPLVTRMAMILVAASTVVSLYALGRRVAGREVATWSAVLLAASPMFFAQSSLAHLDLAAGLFTTLAALALVQARFPLFASTASLAVLTKETAVILLPVAWAFAWRARRKLQPQEWIWLASPLLPLLLWALFYHHATGYWMGNAEYLEYNLYSALSPFRFLWTLPRRLYEVFMGGFNWLLVLGAALGYWRGKKGPNQPLQEAESAQKNTAFAGFVFLAGCLVAVYVIVFSLVGGAVLPRYLLPIFPVYYLLAVTLVWRLPKVLARALCVAILGCLVSAWFINPPWPFPYEDNLSYTDFVRLHQQAAEFLETQADEKRVLTAWPASDELTRPFLGYVHKPLRAVALRGFTFEDFATVPPNSFDVLYVYSLKWQPIERWWNRSALYQEFQTRFLDVAPLIPENVLASRFRLKLLRSFERRGQGVRIYSRAWEPEARRGSLPREVSKAASTAP